MFDVYAQGFDIKGSFQPASLFGTAGNLFTDILIALTSIAGALSLVFVVIGGIKIVTASGDAKKLDAARSQITYAIIGLIVTILAFIILRVVQYFLGSNIQIT